MLGGDQGRSGTSMTPSVSSLDCQPVSMLATEIWGKPSLYACHPRIPSGNQANPSVPV